MSRSLLRMFGISSIFQTQPSWNDWPNEEKIGSGSQLLGKSLVHWGESEDSWDGLQVWDCEGSETGQGKVYKWRKDSMLWARPQQSEDTLWSQNTRGKLEPHWSVNIYFTLFLGIPEETCILIVYVSCVKVQNALGPSGKKRNEFLVHFQGWNSSWDRWVFVWVSKNELCPSNWHVSAYVPKAQQFDTQSKLLWIFSFRNYYRYINYK